MKFYKNTDTVDIAAKSIGISNNAGLVDRGLSIQIRHNRHAGQFRVANELADKIVSVLNERNELKEHLLKQLEDCKAKEKEAQEGSIAEFDNGKYQYWKAKRETTEEVLKELNRGLV